MPRLSPEIWYAPYQKKSDAAANAAPADGQQTGRQKEEPARFIFPKVATCYFGRQQSVGMPTLWKVLQRRAARSASLLQLCNGVQHFVSERA
jgi:hypothetical protein